jgi:hypothetical protein
MNLLKHDLALLDFSGSVKVEARQNAGASFISNFYFSGWDETHMPTLERINVVCYVFVRWGLKDLGA